MGTENYIPGDLVCLLANYWKGCSAGVACGIEGGASVPTSKSNDTYIDRKHQLSK